MQTACHTKHINNKNVLLPLLTCASSHTVQSDSTLHRKILNKRVPNGECVGNVQRITLYNQGLNPCLLAVRFFINTRNMPNSFSGAVAGHQGSPHECPPSTANNNENYKFEMVCSKFRQQSLISDYLPQQLVSDDNLYREQLTEHAPKRV